jgi:peptidoglycan/xylan/chitin deacetylase (PgdA/CDA1 family)
MKKIFFFLLLSFLASPALASASNLVLNPSLETSGGGGPLHWHKNSWGTNSPVFTYPETGRSGKAAKVEIKTYSNGDAKWYFEDIKVSAGQEYVFSDYYKSNRKSNITVRYLMANGSYTYQGLSDPEAAADWTLFKTNITVPANAVSMTVFHVINGVGYLLVDDFSLSILGNEDKFAGGMVSLTFDDGWKSHYTNAKPILDSKNIKGTFYIVSQNTLNSVPYNAVYNSDLRIRSGNTPSGWGTNSWGDNQASFEYPVKGRNDDFAAKVSITQHSSGDAKWWFNDINVTPGKKYRFKDYYKSDAKSLITLRYRMSDNTYRYVGIASLPASADWKLYETEFTIPSGAVSLTVYHLLAEVGNLTIDDYSLVSDEGGALVNPSEVYSLFSAGHEIGAHTKTHPHLTSLSTAQAKTEIEGSKSDLIAMGIPQISSFAYPYGEYNESVKQLTIGAGYGSARSVERGFNTKSTDKFVLKIQQVDKYTTIEDVKGWVSQANNNNTWLILMFHQIDHSGEYYGTTPEVLTAITDYISSSKTKTVTVKEGISLMN